MASVDCDSNFKGLSLPAVTDQCPLNFLSSREGVAGALESRAEGVTHGFENMTVM